MNIIKLFSALPALALVYLPVLLCEIQSYWPEYPNPSIMAGQVEQETCSSLTSKKCWNPRAELKTSREYGFGLGQITIAYNTDGSERFNTFNEIKILDKSLAAWAWENRYSGQLQLRALVLKNYQNWKAITFAATPEDRIFMKLYAYNGGLGAVLKDKKLCDKAPGCDSGKWFGHMEHTSSKSKTPFGGVYGAQSPHSITREYVSNIVRIRAPRYREKIDELSMEFDNGLCKR